MADVAVDGRPMVVNVRVRAVRLRRAMVALASAGGNTVPANELSVASLDPQWAGGRPRLISPEDEAFIVATASTGPKALDQPFTRWSLRKLAAYLAGLPPVGENLRGGSAVEVRIGRVLRRQHLLRAEVGGELPRP
ncbi:MAG: helix-turn-helix domain-containing protein [Actinoallomurus sp.]